MTENKERESGSNVKNSEGLSGSVAVRRGRGSAGRIEYLDALRAIAILAVITIHVLAANWHIWPVDSARWQVLNMWDSAARFCVPLFFMVSGTLFLNPERNVTFQSLARKSMPKVVIPFLVWSVVYASVAWWRKDDPFAWKPFLQDVAVGHYHLWFLLAIFGLYLVTPILRVLVERRDIAWYFVGLSFVFATVLPMLTRAPFVGDTLAEVLGLAKVLLPMGYAGYFVLSLIHI